MNKKLEIKEGMVIHIKTKEQDKKISKLLDGNGYRWWVSGHSLLEKSYFDEHGSDYCIRIWDDKTVGYESKQWFEYQGFTITDVEEILKEYGVE